MDPKEGCEINRKDLSSTIIEKLITKENLPHNEVLIKYKKPHEGYFKINIQERSKTCYFPEKSQFSTKEKTMELNPDHKPIELKTLQDYFVNQVIQIAERHNNAFSPKTVDKLICDGKTVYDSKEWNKLQNNDKILVLDTETTGFKKEDEVLQLTVLDGNGKELMNEYFKPQHTKTWESAEKCNHISPSFVADKPPLLSQKEKIESLLKNADLIVGYNTGYDIKMLEQNGIAIPKDKKYVDIMIPYAEVKNVPNEYGKPKWFKLIDCAKDYGFPEANFHNSLGDTKATLHCYQEMMKKRQLYEGDIKDPSHLVGYNEKEFRRVRGMPDKPKGIQRPASKSNSLER